MSCFKTLKKNKQKRTHNDLQNITQKTKDRATRGEIRCSGKVRSSNYLIILTIFLQEMITSTTWHLRVAISLE